MQALLLTAAVCSLCLGCGGSEAEHRLYAALFENYNQFVRPVKNVSDPVIIQFEVSMSQLVKVDEVNQIMETNLWLKHIWNDYKLRWNPADYGGAEFIRVPSGQIWKPDIVLYNNAVGDFQVDDKTKALLKYTVFVLNVHYRTPKTHTMPVWVRTIFLNLLPRIMFMTRPASDDDNNQKPKPFFTSEFSNLNCFNSSETKCCKDGFVCQDMACSCCQYQRMKFSDFSGNLTRSSSSESVDPLFSFSVLSPEMRDAIESVKYIAENMKMQNEAKEIQDDWKYVAMVIDRIFLWVFILVCILGTAGLFLQPLMAGDEM
ncbi:neuronal acetylcholine receptor subunit alpha-3 isoform X3 [Pezoporus flaviventris]|uniref:neuronal acetylcholine receptor subunit alpha-3 isoform X3 n=1 Tax=Pezoporus flaviventris TaxID=889875 RepID=UPI002AB14332|nr:neuronal acetylcholine receptor subunit alpha-3 isoform X3 [Pezoporus flaviventris]